jgi:hypothetical protein
LENQDKQIKTMSKYEELMAYDFDYLDNETFIYLKQEYQRVGRIIGAMMKNPEKFL